MVFHSNQRGSALLISILLMSFVIVFGLGISSLIVDSVRVERNVVEAGKAYFAAEGGIEETLYFQENELPGYEMNEGGVLLENGAEMSYEMSALAEAVPCAHRDSEWRTLGAQESISLPLFYAGEGDSEQVESFEMEYYVEDFSGVTSNALRWKILGLDSDDLEKFTEAISGLEDFDPTMIDGGNNGMILSSDDSGNHYDLSGVTQTNYEDYPISTFLENHILNYLILTNMADDEMQIQLRTNAVACEYTLIEADGESGGTRQSIDVQVKLDSFLPVFDFVLYQTATNE